MFKFLFATALTAGLLASAPAVKADPKGGPKVSNDNVKAAATDTYKVILLGGEDTLIVLKGDGDTCLEMRVYDENDNLVASDTLGLGDKRRVVVRPKWTGSFTVKVQNLGRMSNNYRITME